MNRAFRVLRKPGECGSLRSIIVALGLAAIVSQAGGLGLGRPLIASSIGQALNLVVPMRLDPDEHLALECVTAQVQAGDAQLPAPLIHVVFDTGNDGIVLALRVTTEPRIEEPVVTVDLALGCPRRMTRQFVVLVDPPVLARLAQVEPAATTQAPKGLDSISKRQAAPEPASTAEGVTGMPADAQPHRRPKRTTARAVAKPRSAAALADVSALDGVAKPDGRVSAKSLAAHKKRQAQTAAQSASESAGRLQLDPAAKLAPTESALAASGVSMAGASALVSPPASGAASGSAGLSETRAQAAHVPPPVVLRQAPRIEAKLGDSKLPTVRTVWRAAQQGSPFALSFGLMGLALIAGVIYVWRLSGQETHGRGLARRQAHELAGRSQPRASRTGREPDKIASAASVTPRSEALRPTAAATPTLHGRDATSVLLDTLQASRKPIPALHEQTQAFVSVGSWADYVSAKFPPETAAPDSGLEPSLVAPATRHDDSLPVLNSVISAADASVAFSSATMATRAVSIEELVDLEQQAEFCVALGQDSAAIELMQDHLRSTAGASVLPYLKLLEIYKRLGDQPSYAAMRSAFAERFGAAPPAWEGDLAGGAGLDAYTAVLDRIQHSWSDFGSSMALVQHLLVPTQDGEAGLYTVAGSLSLPACLDLLMLYSVARDLSAHEVRGNEVDLFLPLDQAGSSAQATSMMATLPRPLLVRPGALFDLDLDLSVGDSAPGGQSARSGS